MKHNIIQEILTDTMPRMSLPFQETKVLNKIIQCQTARLGGHVYQCKSCGKQEVFYNSCRDRHCPNCQGALRVQWVRKRLLELLPVPYFHVVFTLPKELHQAVLQNKKILLNLLFKISQKTLLEAGRDNRNLGAELGGISVLHTWDQKLMFHPHIHMIVPGGGLSIVDNSWISSKENFLISVRRLSILFRAMMLRALSRIYDDLVFTGDIVAFNDLEQWNQLLRNLKKRNWVVYCKRPFANAGKVVNYLGKYTHRIGISNARILKYKDGQVVFAYTDRKHNNKKKVCKIDALSFSKRFALHILPFRFFKIRQFGFLANCKRKINTPIIKKSLCPTESTSQFVPESYLIDLAVYDVSSKDRKCNHCGGTLILLRETTPKEVYLLKFPPKKAFKETG